MAKSRNDAGAELGAGIKVSDAIQNGQLAPMSRDRVLKAMDILLAYKKGKQVLEQRIIENDKWFKLRQWEVIAEKSTAKTNINDIQPKSGWLFNVLMGKQADMIEAYPEPAVLPREEGDKEESSRLTSIVPVLLEQNGFDETYAQNAWSKNTLGGSIYGVLYDVTKLNGLGDIAVSKVDPLSLYWEPGIEDVQDSRNLFYVSLVDRDVLQEQFPDVSINANGNKDNVVERYTQEDEVDITEKTMVVDWYYKKVVDGKQTLQFCQFTGDEVLYATEDSEIGMMGLYHDGDYPFIFDPLFKVPGSLWGFGFVDVAKSSQEMIDLLGQQIIKNAIMGATPRHFMRKDGAVNEEEFADYTKPFVHVNGEITPGLIQSINVPMFSPAYMAVLQQKIEEMKFVTGNQDVMNGGVSGATAASAIMAQMESAGRSSKAAIKASYRAYTKLVLMVIERIRQFYDMPRQFRIIGERGAQKYIEYSNQGIQPEQTGPDSFRKPLFDITVKAAKQTAYTKLAQNELILDLFNRGFFSPQMADQAIIALELMEFEGKDEAIQKISKQAQLARMLEQYISMALALAAKYEPEKYEQLVAQLEQEQTEGMPRPVQGQEQNPDRMGQSPGVKAGMTRMENAGRRASQASQPT